MSMRKVRWPDEIQFEVPVKGWQHNHTTNDLPDCSIWPETHLLSYPNVECAPGYLGALWCFAELMWPLVYYFYFFSFSCLRVCECSFRVEAFCQYTAHNGDGFSLLSIGPEEALPRNARWCLKAADFKYTAGFNPLYL